MLALLALGIIHFLDLPTTSGNQLNASLTVCVPRKNDATRTQIVYNRLCNDSTRTNARQPSASCDAHFARAPKLKQPMAAFDINSPSARVGLRRKLGSTMCFRLAFSPVLCAADLHLLVSTRLDILCFASVGTVCSVVSG